MKRFCLFAEFLVFDYEFVNVLPVAKSFRVRYLLYISAKPLTTIQSYFNIPHRVCSVKQ